ncbi:hypothetical protein GUJ93_ZPchr0005g14501 [Zizania palustris]|uniref:Uncharacterized protein n=1 Tax=Zizania palustris TaxID=103762 RepID=A0A8J5SC77_ZIZPA|nr:hypothetical protein GUJ93_ZPchr0005g14501 [Zizania palustris]
MNRRPQIGRDPSLSWLMSGPSTPLLIPINEIEALRSSPCPVHGYDPCRPRMPPLPSPTLAWEDADLPLGPRPFRHTLVAIGEHLDPHRASALVQDLEHQGEGSGTLLPMWGRSTLPTKPLPAGGADISPEQQQHR